MSNVTWQDFETDYSGIIRGGLSGQSGDMPPELHMKKLEQTCMYERESQLEDHFRSILRDTTPDQVSMAQDMPRYSQDQTRSEIINVRHSGARTAEEPTHPDLFLGFTDRDSRGHHDSGPDFRKINGHSETRGKYKDFLSDHASDWTVPGGHRSELKVIKDIRKTVYPAKQRMKWFDTSRDGRGNTGSNSRIRGSKKPLTTIDGVMLDLNNTQGMGQRNDNTTVKSNNIKIGYRTTGDHRFSVAQYGILSNKQQKVNIHSSQYKNKQSHKYDVSPSEIKNRLACAILKESWNRRKLEGLKREDTYIKNSKTAKNKINKILSDMSHIQRSTKQTADSVDLGYVSSNIRNIRVYDPISHEMVLVDKKIFDKVKENKNVTFVKKVTSPLNRNTFSEGKQYVAGNEVSVYVYSRKNKEFTKQLPTKMEHCQSKAVKMPIYKNNHSPAQIMNVSSTYQGQSTDPHADAVFERFKSGKSQHWDAKKMLDIDAFNYDPVNDADTSIRSARKMAGRSKM